VKTLLLNNIFYSTKLYAPIKYTQEINSAILLAETMLNDLPEGLFRDFIFNNLNYDTKYLGFVDKNNCLQSKYWIKPNQKSK
jgi:hypothetical protein